MLRYVVRAVMHSAVALCRATQQPVARQSAVLLCTLLLFSPAALSSGWLIDIVLPWPALNRQLRSLPRPPLQLSHKRQAPGGGPLSLSPLPLPLRGGDGASAAGGAPWCLSCRWRRTFRCRLSWRHF